MENESDLPQFSVVLEEGQKVRLIQITKAKSLLDLFAEQQLDPQKIVDFLTDAIEEARTSNDLVRSSIGEVQYFKKEVEINHVEMMRLWLLREMNERKNIKP